MRTLADSMYTKWQQHTTANACRALLQSVISIKLPHCKKKSDSYQTFCNRENEVWPTTQKKRVFQLYLGMNLMAYLMIKLDKTYIPANLPAARPQYIGINAKKITNVCQIFDNKISLWSN
jgi:hypothetical protein